MNKDNFIISEKIETQRRVVSPCFLRKLQNLHVFATNCESSKIFAPKMKILAQSIERFVWPKLFLSSNFTEIQPFFDEKYVLKLNYFIWRDFSFSFYFQNLTTNSRLISKFKIFIQDVFFKVLTFEIKFEFSKL